MTATRISEDYAASAQIRPEDLDGIAAAGFRTVMCNRPDGEEPGQPPFAEIAAAAEARGLVAIHVPVVSGQITQENVDDFRAALDGAPGPVFAYCRSGSRCQTLWRLTH